MRPVRLPATGDFGSRLRSAAVAARVGLWLGVCFGVCFLTGLLSHYAQEPHQPVPFPTSPAWGYRVTQGLHVTTGVVAVPLLLVKLWSVYPRLFDRLPPLRAGRRLVAAGLHRLSIGVLVAASVFQLATGLANSSQWYPWSFSFRSTHYAVAWIAIGALVLHVAIKLPVIRDALGADVDATDRDRPDATRPGALTRRGLLRSAWAAAAVAALTTAGSAVPWLRQVSVFAVRSGEGPQGVPVNTSAEEADVEAAATDPAWRLEVVGPGGVVRLDRRGLLGMRQHSESLPIACVEGWSAGAEWSGVRVRDLMDLVGAPRGGDVVVTSLQQSGPFTVTTLQGGFADDERTLLALALHGEPLHLDHGFPCRLIAPNRPGVLQTKWVARLEAA